MFTIARVARVAPFIDGHCLLFITETRFRKKYRVLNNNAIKSFIPKRNKAKYAYIDRYSIVCKNAQRRKKLNQ